jgi:superoxide reductase
MTQVGQVYRCYVCGNVVEVLTPGVGELICCGVAMVLLREKTDQPGRQMHVPVLERTGTGVLVRVGQLAHPMEPGHFIEWLEVRCGGQVCRRQLQPQEPPEAEFPGLTGDLVARACCNRHGLWRTSAGT